MKRLVINADDFGLTPAVNYGIIDAFINGILSSTTLMINQPYTLEAIELAKKFKKLGLGIHLTFDKGSSVAGISSLTDSKGIFHSAKKLYEVGVEEDFFKEAKAQIEKFIECVGKLPTHIDSHHHIHMRCKASFEAVKRVAKLYNLKYRIHEKLLDSFYDKNVTVDYLIKKLSNVNSEFYEVMCHPGFCDKILLKVSSYNNMRESELEVLKDLELKKFIAKNFVLIDFLGNIK